MLKPHHKVLVGALCFFNTVLAYPQRSSSSVARADKFIIGSMGDSWASGVTFPTWKFWRPNDYDNNKDGCMRYKYAWSTVVHSRYAEWAPEGAPGEADLEFRACSGGRLGDNMRDQMDLMSRPKVVLMEVGGNNANFYPLADACLFHAEGKNYGMGYEDDNGPPGNREGECRKEIDLVRERLTGNAMADFQEEIKKQIHAWRGHKSVTGNDAALLAIGYARFFAEGPECNDYTFNIPGSPPQNIVLEMRKEINELIGLMNQAIQSATDSFQDDKIHYINIDPAFETHRFCEPKMSSWDQFNNNDKVWIWNEPLRFWITLTKDGETKEYQRGDGVIMETFPPADVYNDLIHHQDGQATWDGEYTVVNYKDPNNPDTTMTVKFIKKDNVGVLNGSKARTLHPTESGHREMGNIIVQRLKQVIQKSVGPVIVGPPCPSGCTCSGPEAVPACP